MTLRFLFGLTLCVFLASCTSNFSQALETSITGRVAALFDDIQDDPVRLRIFLRDMPKGGDLHTHLSGTPYAEEFLKWAEDRAFCIDTEALSIEPPPCDWPEAESTEQLRKTDPALYGQLVDAMSVRALLSGRPTDESGHQQFFGSFDRFLSIVSVEQDLALVSAQRAAAEDRVLYLELMYNPSAINGYAFAGVEADWNDDLARAFERLAPDLPEIVRAARTDADLIETSARQTMQCVSETPEPGCATDVAFNCYGLRLLPAEQVFRQLAACFALIDADPRFLGVSLVQPEDDPNAVINYDLHMRMVGFLSDQFPSAKVSLHAGELTLGLVPGYALRDHIAKAIDIAGSDRIGHGVGIAFELNSRETLARMAREEIAVEINLSSNRIILGVLRDNHPLNLYRASGVPIVLSTDDLGVLRTDMTEQYVRAAIEHGLDYAALKAASRNSAHYAFLPGESLWVGEVGGPVVSACLKRGGATCLAYLSAHPKAALEFRLEQAFEVFEADIVNWTP
ncbi:MAG: adenosine deaminase [Pseudomonadota bacterium]